MINRPTHLTQESESLEFYRMDQSAMTDLQFSLYEVSGQPIHFRDEAINEIILSLTIRERE